MAIKIPVRSSRSEYVGGNIIKTPQDKGQVTVNLPQGSKLIERVPRISYNWDKIGDDLLKYSTAKKTHDKEIEAQRIKNLNAMRSSQIADELDDLLEKMQNDNNLATDSSKEDFLTSTTDYESHYKLEADKLIKKYTKLYKEDDDAFAIFYPNMLELVRSGQANMRKIRRKKVIAEGKIAFSIENKLIDKQLDSLSADTVFLALPKINKKIKEIYTTALKNGFITDADVEKRLSDIEFGAWQTVLSAGKEYVDNMTDKSEIDYQSIYNELSASKATGTYFGKKLTTVMKERLLKWSKEKALEQSKMKVETDARLDTENSKSINELLDNAKTDISLLKLPEGSNPREYIAHIINNTKLTDKTKDAHFKELDSIFPKVTTKDTDTTTYGSNIALDEWYDEILAGGYKKGNKFKQSILQDKRLTPKGKKWLIDLASKYEKERDVYSTELVTNFLKGFDLSGTDGLDSRLIGWINHTKNEVRMTLETVLAEGEAAGISIHSMLGDASSEHYVGYDLMEIYQQTILDIIGNKVGTKKTFKEILEVSPKEYFKEKRDQAYSIFFDADPDKDGNQLAFEKAGTIVDEKDYVTAVEAGTIDTSQAIFLQRLLKKPMPPERKWEGPPKMGGYESIEAYITSNKYKKYRLEYANWIDEGNFNSSKIPSFKKFFGTIDIPTTKVKN